jgi:hypothetical protein
MRGFFLLSLNKKAMKRLLFILILIFVGFSLLGQSPLLEHARKTIYEEYGVSVFVKGKTLRKFGRNTDLGTVEETISSLGGIENFPTGNDITKISSSSASDGVIMFIEGYTRHGNDIYFVTQSKILSGQTPVLLDSALYRITRIYNNSSVNLAGDVYAYRTGTTVTDSTHIKVPYLENQSLKASTTLSTSDFWVVTQGVFSVGVSGNQDRRVQFRLHVRMLGKVFRTYDLVTTSNLAGPFQATFDPPIIIPAGADVSVDAVSSGVATEVTSTISGYLLTINRN